MEEDLLEEQPITEAEQSIFEILKSMFLSLDNIDEEEYKIDLSVVDNTIEILKTKDTIRKIVNTEGIDDLFLLCFKAWDLYKQSSSDSTKLKQILQKLTSNLSVDYYKENLSVKSNIND